MSKSNQKCLENKSILEFYDGKSIFVTGAAGFLGVILLETFLRCFSGIQFIYILLRSKKGVSPEERKNELFKKPIFKELRENNPSAFSKVLVVNGDVSLPNMGMSEEDLLQVIENVTIVFHCAASISFMKPLKYLLVHNAGGVNNAIELCKKLRHCEVLVDTSTAYSNSNRRLKIEERVYRLPYPAQRFLEYARSGKDESLEQISSECKPDFPNSYVLSKCISENLILENASDIPTAIIRPSLISSTWKGPLPGYSEENSNPAQLLNGIGKGFIKVSSALPEATYEFIPVDVVANTHVIAAYSVATGRNPSPFVVNCTSYGSVPHPVTFKQLIPLYLKLVHRYPLPNTFRYSNHVWSGKNTVVKEIISLFEHYIPAVGFDFILTLKGKKPRLMSLYRYLDKVMMTSTYFMTRNWEYEIKNFRNLKNEVSPEETKMFYTDIGDLNFEEYANDLPKGAPYFDWRLDKMPKTKRLKLAKKFYHFTVYMQVVSIIILFWIFYSLCSLMANMSLTN